MEELGVVVVIKPLAVISYGCAALMSQQGTSGGLYWPFHCMFLYSLPTSLRLYCTYSWKIYKLTLKSCGSELLRGIDFPAAKPRSHRPTRDCTHAPQQRFVGCTMGREMGQTHPLSTNRAVKPPRTAQNKPPTYSWPSAVSIWSWDWCWKGLKSLLV